MFGFRILRINFLVFILIFLSEMRVIHNFTLEQNSIENGVTWKFDNFYLLGKDLHLYLNSKDLFNVDKSYRFEGMKVCFWAAFYTELQVKQMERQFSIIFTGNFTEGNIAVIHSLVIWSDGSLQIIFTDKKRSITAATKNETISFDCLYYYICYSIKITKGSIFDSRNQFELTLFDRKIKLNVRIGKLFFFSNPLGSSIGSDSHTGFLYWALFNMNIWDSFDAEKSKLEICNTKPCQLEEICLPLPGENSRKCLCPSGKSCHTNLPFCYNGGIYITFNNTNHCVCSYDYTGVQCEEQRANRSFQVSIDSQILFIKETAKIVISSNFTLQHSVNVKWYLDQGTILEYVDTENCSSCSKRIHGFNEFTHVWLQNQSDWECNITFTSEGLHYINIEVKEVSFRANLSFAVSQRIKEIILKTKSHFGRIGHEVEFLLGVSNLGNMPEFIWNINQSEFYADLPESVDDDDDELSEFFPQQIPHNITKYVKQKWIFESAGCFNINVTAKITGRIDTSVVDTICIILESDMYKFYTNSTITEVDGALSLLLIAVEDKTDTEYTFIVDNENVSVQYHLQKSDSYENLPAEYKMLTSTFFYANVTVVFDRTETSSVGIIIRHRNRIIYDKIIEIVVVNKICKPSVNILNVGLNQETPTVYFRRDPIIFRSITKFNCQDKVYPQWEWKLFDSSLKTEFAIKEISNLSYLSFPERSLPYGTYAVKLVVKVFQMSKIISSENIRWFSVNQSKPIAKILGGIERVVSVDDELILDGSSSYDPDFSDADMNFTWICLIGECSFDSVTGKKKVIVIPKDQLKLTKYVFGLIVSHLNRQSLPFHQEVEVREGHLPILYVKCLSNCRTSVNLSEKLALKVNCSHCSDKPQYLWKMVPNKNNKKTFIDWDNETLYGNSSGLLLIFSNVLQEGDSYLFTVTTGRENGGQAQYKVDVYKKPRVEKCTIKPEKGISLETQFTIECFGVYDENMPINYQFFFDNKLHYDRFLLRTSTHPKMVATILPIGNENDNYKADISIILTNEIDMHTEVNLVVQVLPPHSSLTAIRDWFDDDKLERFLSSGDNEEAVVILESLTQVLKNNSEELHYRNEMINMLDKLPLINIFGVKQSSHALYAMSQTDEEFSDDSKIKLTEFIRKAVQSFSKFSETQYLCSEEKFDTAKSIFLGSSGALGAIIGKKINASDNFYDGITYYQDTDYYNYRPSNEINCALGSKIINFVENVSDVLMWEIITNDNYTKISSELFDVFLQRYDEENYTEHNLGNIIKISEDIFGEDTKVRMILNSINPFICDDNSPLINTKTLILNVKHEKKAKNVKVESLLKRKEFSKNTQRGKAEIRLYNNRTACNVIISTHRTIIPNDNFTLQLSLTSYTQKTSFIITVTKRKPTIDDFFKWHYIISYSEQNKYYLTIPENLTIEGGTYFVGVLPYSALTIRALNLNINAKSRLEDVVIIEYSLDIFITKCFSYAKAWSDEGCHVGNSSTDISLHCHCSHLSVFSGSYFVVPNKVDVTQTIVLLGTVSRNPVILMCLIVIWIIYLMLLFWARRTDKKNAKRNIKILSDNAESNRCYAVLISTGFRKDSGTTSRVYMQLEGINGKSQIFQMNDPEQEFFKSGSEDRFIIRTQSDIGQITRLHVWHNNSGLKPSWFLDKIEIQDLASEETIFFPGRWFAVDKADGKIYAVLEPTDLKRYKVLFMKAISSQFREHHIWFSLFYSSPSSNFTRSQRLTCILNILLASMLANIMFYGIDVTDPQDQLEIRYFKFSISEMIIGIQSCIIAFFVGIFMAAIFRNIRREKVPVITQFPQIKYPKIFYGKESIASLKITETLPFLRKQLPSWFSYVAWFITIVSSLIYTYFILLYGLTYGYKRSISWLLSIFTSLCSSIFILQPGKAMIFSIIIAYILAKKSKELIVNSEKIKESQSEIPQGYISRNELHHYRHLKNRESKILFILSDSFMFICFTIAIQILVHNNRNHMAYFSNRATKSIFISGAYGGRPFTDVTTLQHLKEYLNSTLLRGMHKEEWYNGEKFENGYTADGLTLLVGVARLRQVRIKPAICMEQVLPLRSFCLPEYSLYAEDNNSYKSGWARGIAIRSAIKKPTPWVYQTAKKAKASKKYGELNVYSGGGYTALLGRKRQTTEKKLRRLLSRNWIDTKSRALFVDITTYNGNINVFTSISLTFEISGLGNVIPTYSIVTSNFDIFVQVTNFQAGISEICCFLLILIFTYREVKNLYKMKTKYFKNFWNIFELIFLLFGYFFVGITIKQSLGISGIWNRREEFQHVSFENAAKWDKIFLILQSIMVTLTTLKLWKILSFIQTFKLPYETLKIAFKSIGHFTFMLILLMMSIMNFCVISFGGWVKHMRNLLQTMYSLMNYSLGEFEIEELAKTDQFFGPLFIFIFVVVVSWLFLTLIISILIDSFHTTIILKKQDKPRLEVANYVHHQLNILFRKTSTSWIEKTHKKWLKEQDEVKFNN